MGRPPVGEVAMTGAERTRKWREKFRHDEPVTKSASADNAALVKEVARLKAKITELEARIRDMGLKTPKPEPKAERPLPPDEARGRIKDLTITVSNLRVELRYMREWQANRMSKGVMSFDAKTKIAKALHPEHKPTSAERDDALKAFTQFISGQRRAARKK